MHMLKHAAMTPAVRELLNIDKRTLKIGEVSKISQLSMLCFNYFQS